MLRNRQQHGAGPRGRLTTRDLDGAAATVLHQHRAREATAAAFLAYVGARSSATSTARRERRGPTDDRSPVERERDLIASHRDFPRWLWGVGWGTLLGPAHVAAIRGPTSLEAVRGTVYQVPGGRWWVELGPDPAAVPEEQAAALLAALAPALRDADDRPAGDE